MATHSSVLAWRIPGMGEPGGLPSMGSHRVEHDWSDLAAAAAAAVMCVCSVAQSSLILCDPMDYSLPGFSVHGNSPGKNTGVHCHFQLQGIFPTQGLNLCLLCLLSWQANSFIISATWEGPNFSCLSTKYKFYFTTTYSRVFSNKYF